MRILGIDFGSKRVGVAISDETGRFAFPNFVYENNKELLNKIKGVCEEHGVKKVVIGESKDYKMKDNPIMKKINKFVSDWQSQSDIQIVLHPELLTSAQAMRIDESKEGIDARAAALILQDYLDNHLD